MRLTSILVATDLSEPADEAIVQGHELAELWQAQLTVLHVVPHLVRANPLFPQENWQDAVALPEMMEQAAGVLASRVIELTKRTEDSFTVVVDRGEASTVIQDQVEQLQPDLLVVGSRGESSISSVMFGGVSKRVVGDVPCSVLIARPTLSTNRILAAVEQDETGKVLEVAHELAQKAGAELTVLRTMLANGAPEVEIPRAAEAIGAQLVVVGADRRVGLAKVARGGVGEALAEGVARDARCSVLVVRLGG